MDARVTLFNESRAEAWTRGKTERARTLHGLNKGMQGQPDRTMGMRMGRL